MGLRINVDNVVQKYKILSQIPAAVGANILNSNTVNTVWSQRNIEKGKSTKFQRSIFIQNSKNVGENMPVDMSSELMSKYSASQKFRAVLREGENNKQYLEVWQQVNLLRTVDLQALDMHGAIYADGTLGALEWSPDEKKLLYVAEKKKADSEPFYKRKGKSKETDDTKQPSKGEQYLFEQDWGEQLVGKKQSVIVQYDVESDTVTLVDGLPEKGIFVASPKYAPDGSYIIGVAYYTEPRKLGLIYCSNRPSTIFRIDFSSNYEELNLQNMYVESPQFSPDGKYMLWLQRKSGGPHASCMELVKCAAPLEKNSKVTVIVPIVLDAISIKHDKSFHGLYHPEFPRRCWVSANKLVLNSNQQYTVNSYVIDIESGDVTELEYSSGSQRVFDVAGDMILAVRRNFLQPDKIMIGKIGSDESIEWNDLTSNQQGDISNCMYKYLDLVAEGDSDNVFNAIYIGPESGENHSVPIIVWPHGGPHSVFPNCFMLELSLFLSFNYGVLLVNYRGSLGAGENSVNFLPGKVGSTDVADCIQALDAALKEFPWLNPDAVALCGGSHGGFLVTHLSGQYPSRFKAVVARNPVIDIASMSITSDIPDWTYVEAGKEYTQEGEVDNELLMKMRLLSPIVHAHKVKAPTLLQIGSKDLRVPPHQGTEYYLRLKANGVKARMNLYDDNHPLGSVPNEMDNIINTLLWIDEHVH